MIASLRSRLAAGKPAIGLWSTVSSPLVAEAMAALGFHWMAVDMEHGTPDVDAAAALFLAAERHGVVPLARLPSADPYLGRRLLDQGAAGLIVPVVEDAEVFAAFARHCAYPGTALGGRRGVGLSRCNRWGADFAPYLAGFRPLLVPQIETRKGVEAAAAIAVLPEVDALFLGPYDLSADLGCAGDFGHVDYRQALARVLECAAAKPLGIHQVAPDPAELAARIAEGFRFVAYATDLIAMRAALATAAPLLHEDSP